MDKIIEHSLLILEIISFELFNQLIHVVEFQTRIQQFVQAMDFVCQLTLVDAAVDIMDSTAPLPLVLAPCQMKQMFVLIMENVHHLTPVNVSWDMLETIVP